MQVFSLARPPEIEKFDAVIIRRDAVESMEEIELAYYLAKKAFENKQNIAKQFKYEFLLWLSGTRDIKNALKKTVPKDECLLILFSGSKPKEGKEIQLKKTGDPLRLEAIALSRI
ncbi:hypothetical protein KKB44_06310 [Candidatus Micrarchaeota archaeon]|nr:hypothetical protein [Candidatus Micrarchaeota archaeon]